jgi:hypothetical protein
MRESIAKVVYLFRNSPELDDDEVFERLIAEGIERRLAASLLTLLPMVYVRIMLEKSKVRFAEFYEQQLPSGGSEKRQLSSEPAWEPSNEFARAEISRGISKQDLLNVAGRSAEFDALNRLLNHGHKLDTASMTPCLVPWRE